MNKYTLNTLVALLVNGLLFVSNSVYAEAHPYDFHANSKMLHKQYGPVDKAYGLVNVATDSKGNGAIDVMFSNGSQIGWVKFNAQLTFIDANGRILQQQHIYRWLDAANEDGASERKVSKTLTVSGFDTIEVDFYLTEVPEAFAGDAFSNKEMVNMAASENIEG